MPRLATLFAIFMLALPGAAFAQGAGDDQYQDPFGDEPAQNDGGSSGDDDGLSQSPPTTGGDDSSGGDAGGGGSDGTTAPSTPATPEPSQAPAAEASGTQLPRTGSDPLILLALGAGLVLIGVGLRLKTIDPDAF